MSSRVARRARTESVEAETAVMVRPSIPNGTTNGTVRNGARRTVNGATAPATPHSALVLLGRYVLEEEIGRGGMAAVYRAIDTTLERPVAVKVLHAHACEQPTFVEHFLATERRVARLSHPHLVTVFDAGHDAGKCFVVMEYIASGSLRRVLDCVEGSDPADRRPPLPLADAVRIISDIADALQYLHEQGIVHGDVKPDNILLDEHGRAKLADFGLAQLARASEVTRTVVDGGSAGNQAGSEGSPAGLGLAGTAAYLAPEQIEHGRTDAHSDLYALGLVAYELLAGKRPFESEHWVAATTQRLVRDPEPLAILRPEVPPSISNAVMRALARDPQARYTTAGEFRDALQQRSPAGESGVPSADPPAPAPELVQEPHAPDETGLLAVPAIPAKRQGTVSPVSVAASFRQSALASWHNVLPWTVQTLWQRPVGRSRVVAARSLAHLRESLAWTVDRARRLDPRVQAAAAVALVVGALLLAPVLYRIANPPRTVVVANLAGKELADARQTAEQTGVPVRLSVMPSDTVPKGHVVRQEPAADTPFASDRPLTLFVSSGPAPVRMPDLRQRRLEDARQDLKAAGLSVGTVTEFETSRQPWGAVLTQSAYPGRLVPPGTAVDVTVSVPARVEIPAVVGQMIGDAEAALQKRGLRLSGVHQEPVPGKRAGTVIAQDPPAGVQVRQGESVSVTIAVPAAG